MTSNGLEQEQRLSLQVYESHIYVYDEINLYEQLMPFCTFRLKSKHLPTRVKRSSDLSRKIKKMSN